MDSTKNIDLVFLVSEVPIYVELENNDKRQKKTFLWNGYEFSL